MVSGVTSFLVSCPSPFISWDLIPIPLLFFFLTAVGGKTLSLAPGVLDLGGAITIWVSTEASGRIWMTELGFGLEPQELLWGTCEVWWVEFCSDFPGGRLQGGG